MDQVSTRIGLTLQPFGGEVAAGIRVRPLVHIPVWLTAERRHRIGRFGGGRTDFGLFAEAGVYQQPIPWRIALDSYLQGGVVGVKARDLFVDGSLAVTRPVYRNFSFGFGVWDGAQPGLSRLDLAAGDDSGPPQPQGTCRLAARACRKRPPGLGPGADARGRFLSSLNLAAAAICG